MRVVFFLLVTVVGVISAKYIWLEGPTLHRCWGYLRQTGTVFWIRSLEVWNLTESGRCYTRQQVERAVARENFTVYGSYACGQMACLDPHVLEEKYPIAALLCTEGKFILVYILPFFCCCCYVDYCARIERLKVSNCSFSCVFVFRN
jgi:hypothetical protein